MKVGRHGRLHSTSGKEKLFSANDLYNPYVIVLQVDGHSTEKRQLVDTVRIKTVDRVNGPSLNEPFEFVKTEKVQVFL